MPSQLKFVVHRHQARRLHWDLRLEMDGVLASWAVPKEPATVKGVKRLAIRVEDHPLDYISFHGVIPEGRYGAGVVEIWDEGYYILKERGEDVLKVAFKGRRLNGEYRLIRIRGDQWLLFKVGEG